VIKIKTLFIFIMGIFLISCGKSGDCCKVPMDVIIIKDYDYSVKFEEVYLEEEDLEMINFYAGKLTLKYKKEDHQVNNVLVHDKMGFFTLKNKFHVDAKPQAMFIKYGKLYSLGEINSIFLTELFKGQFIIGYEKNSKRYIAKVTEEGIEDLEKIIGNKYVFTDSKVYFSQEDSLGDRILSYDGVSTMTYKTLDPNYETLSTFIKHPSKLIYSVNDEISGDIHMYVENGENPEYYFEDVPYGLRFITEKADKKYFYNTSFGTPVYEMALNSPTIVDVNLDVPNGVSYRNIFFAKEHFSDSFGKLYHITNGNLEVHTEFIEGKAIKGFQSFSDINIHNKSYFYAVTSDDLIYVYSMDTDNKIEEIARWSEHNHLFNDNGILRMYRYVNYPEKGNGYSAKTLYDLEGNKIRILLLDQDT